MPLELLYIGFSMIFWLAGIQSLRVYYFLRAKNFLYANENESYKKLVSSSLDLVKEYLEEIDLSKIRSSAG